MKALGPVYGAVYWHCSCCLITVLALAALVCLPGCRRAESQSSISDFTLPQVRGGSFHSRGTDGPRLLLVAFLQTVPDTANTPSRQQVPFLLSMQHQYRGCGLKVVIVDSTKLATGEAPTRDALINASHDWQSNIPLLEDDGNRVAHRWGVDQLPTLMLLRSDGTLAQRWSRLTRPSILAQGIEKLCGGPLARNSR